MDAFNPCVMWPHCPVREDCAGMDENQVWGEESNAVPGSPTFSEIGGEEVTEQILEKRSSVMDRQMSTLGRKGRKHKTNRDGGRAAQYRKICTLKETRDLQWDHIGDNTAIARQRSSLSPSQEGSLGSWCHGQQHLHCPRHG